MIDVDATGPFSAPAIIGADRDGAVRCSPSHCPGANALRRARGVRDARVGATIMWLTRRDRRIRYQLEPNTKAAVKAYDKAGEDIPVGFVFHFIPPAKPLGSRAGEQPGSNRRSGARTSVATRTPSHRHIDVEPS